MSLNWTEIGERWPDAVVMWDRDVAPTLDWEPVFRANGDLLWADDPECTMRARSGTRGYGRCRCRCWLRGQWRTIAHHGAATSLWFASLVERVKIRASMVLCRGYDSVSGDVSGLIGEYMDHLDRGSDKDVDNVARWIAYRILQREARPNSNVLPL